MGEAIWDALHENQPENSTKPYWMRDYGILVRRGEGDDFGATSLEKSARVA